MGHRAQKTAQQSVVRAKARAGKAKLGFILSVAMMMILALMAHQALAQNFRFDSVSIEGNKRIGDSSIIRTAGIPRGQAVSAGDVNAALQRLQRSGLFESVSVEPRGRTLAITVVERPTINRINFEGNRRLKDDALAAIISSSERRVFNPAQVERDATAISEAYANQGRIAARVTPRIIRRSDNRVDVVYEILEGALAEIERLSFVGNRVYSDRRLRRVLETKQAGLFRQLIQRDTLVEDRIQFDQQLLRDFYLSRGYVDFRVNSVNAELAQERDGYFLVFNVQEGQQFKFGEITVVSELPGVDADLFRSILKTRPGVVYSPSLVDIDIARMERQGIRDGVDFMRIEPRVTRNERDLTLDVEYAISRGDRIFVERIDVEGNTSTLDRVVRNQFKTVEGDPFNPREIRQAAERIRALGYFASSEVNAREGSSPEQVVIDVDVEEQPTGSFAFGGAYSNNDGFGLAINFSEQNFLGRGQKLILSISTAQESRDSQITFIEPQLLGRDLEFGLNMSLRDNTSNYANYDYTRFNFRPYLAFPVSENGRLQVRYTVESLESKARTPNNAGVVINREIAAGETWSSALGYTYTYDTRLTGLDPTAGVLFEFGQDFAGLGGDDKFIKTRAKVIGQKMIANEEITLRATFEAGALNWRSGVSRAPNRFILNNSIVRGFEPGGIGPRDLSGGDDALGGNFFVAARLDAEFPIGLPEEYGIRGGAFLDVGNLWNLGNVDTTGANIVGEGGSLRSAVGVSILWDTPFGPLRFNFSRAIKKETFDKTQNFDLTISTKF